jgi:hypothetical protein
VRPPSLVYIQTHGRFGAHWCMNGVWMSIRWFSEADEDKQMDLTLTVLRNLCAKLKSINKIILGGSPSLWIHSLVVMFAGFQAPISFLGPGKDNLDMEACYWSFCLFLHHSRMAPLMALSLALDICMIHTVEASLFLFRDVWVLIPKRCSCYPNLWNCVVADLSSELVEIQRDCFIVFANMPTEP